VNFRLCNRDPVKDRKGVRFYKRREFTVLDELADDGMAALRMVRVTMVMNVVMAVRVRMSVGMPVAAVPVVV
jgi:hypothetical protein